MSNTKAPAADVDDIRKGLSRVSVDDDDDGWLGGAPNNKKKGRGRGGNNNVGSRNNNNNTNSTNNTPARGRGQSPNNKNNSVKDKVKIVAIAWDQDVLLTLQKHPDLELDSSLKALMLQTPEVIITASDSETKVSKRCLSKAFTVPDVPKSLARYKQLKHNEIVAQEVKHNGQVIGSIYFCVTSSPPDKISSYNLFKTYPIRAFKPNFLFEDQFVRFSGPVIHTQHEGNEYILCSSNRTTEAKEKLDLFGGACNFTVDQSPAHSAAREFLEEVSYVAEDVAQVQQQLVSLFDTCQKKYVFRALAYKVALDQLPEQIRSHVPQAGQEKELKENDEKEKVFWMQPKDILASEQFRFGPKNSIKEFYGLN